MEAKYGTLKGMMKCLGLPRDKPLIYRMPRDVELEDLLDLPIVLTSFGEYNEFEYAIVKSNGGFYRFSTLYPPGVKQNPPWIRVEIEKDEGVLAIASKRYVMHEHLK